MIDKGLLKKLRWRCRRGTKELDLILLGYLENQYPSATLEEQQAFEALLELPDDCLWRHFLDDDKSIVQPARTSPGCSGQAHINLL